MLAATAPSRLSKLLFWSAGVWAQEVAPLRRIVQRSPILDGLGGHRPQPGPPPPRLNVEAGVSGLLGRREAPR